MPEVNVGPGAAGCALFALIVAVAFGMLVRSGWKR